MRGTSTYLTKSIPINIAQTLMTDKNHTLLHFFKTNKMNLFLGILLLVLLLIESKTKGDFDIFMSASKDLLAGENIYQISYHEWYHYYYDVLFALLISPLQVIPIYWANFIWLLLNLFFTYRIWKIISFYLPVKVLKDKKQRWLKIISFFLVFSLWYKNIHLTQMTIFILYLCLEGIYAIEYKKTLLGSILIAVGISIKILPILLIPYLIYRGYFKAIIYILIALAVVLFLPALIIGYEYHLFLLNERWILINPLNKEHVLDVSERSFHSLTSLLSVLFVENAGNAHSLDLKRNIANVNMETLQLIINAVRLFFIILTLYFIRALPFKRTTNKLQLFYELSYILLIIPLIFPHQQHYAFFFVFPAISYLVFYILIKYFNAEKSNLSRPKKIALIGFVFVIYLLLNSHFILGAFRNIYDHYKTLTYGVLLIIPLLAIMRPTKIEGLLEEKEVV